MPAWLASAMAVHAAALGALALAPYREASRSPTASTDVASVAALETASVDVSLEGAAGTTGEARREPPSDPPAQANREASASPLVAARAPTAGAASATPGVSSSEPMSMSNPVPSGSGEPSGQGVVALPLTPGELGIAGPGGRNPFLPRREEKEPTQGPNTPAARAMRGTGLAHDRALGLGPEGPAISALSEATTASIAPLRGRATFIVRTGGDGLVSAVDLLDSEGGPGWLDAGRLAFEKLRGKKMNVPRGASGMNMHIEVRSEMKLPSGQSAAVGGRLGEDNSPQMTFDVADVGAKPRRVIHARAVGTDVF